MIELLDQDATGALPIWGLRPPDWLGWIAGQSPRLRQWAESQGFRAEAGKHLLLPDDQGGLRGAVVGLPDQFDLWTFAGLATDLPAMRWIIANPLSPLEASEAALGWALDGYRFNPYRKNPQSARARLVWPQGADQARVARLYRAVALARDLISMPANDLGPAELAQAAASVARTYGAALRLVEGEDLRAQNYPLIHAVGRASSRAPRLIDLVWDNSGGRSDAPRLTLVGKGVCFDSGGLDIKTASGMALMKKDMGGAAIALGLAQAIMDAGWPVRLRLLIAAVDNAIAGDAFRPGDVIRSRKGLTVEIGNTDAEGRLILADALADADAESPDMMIDLATLTGAARVALGPELPALFSTDDAFADLVLRTGLIVNDPAWRLPLWAPYRKMMASKIADINNSNESGMAGSITAALFLKDFVERTKSWTHFDVYAWNAQARPGRREVGGEAMLLRNLYLSLAQRFGFAA